MPYDWELEALDVKTAFLFGELKEEIYMDQPEGFVVKGKKFKVCRLWKAIYGLKQAALQWNKQLHKSLLKMGFETTKGFDPLKGLAVIAYYEKYRGGEKTCLKPKSQSLLGKVQENLTEVLWRRLWPLYTTHSVCT